MNKTAATDVCSARDLCKYRCADGDCAVDALCRPTVLSSSHLHGQTPPPLLKEQADLCQEGIKICCETGGRIMLSVITLLFVVGLFQKRLAQLSPQCFRQICGRLWEGVLSCGPSQSCVNSCSNIGHEQHCTFWYHFFLYRLSVLLLRCFFADVSVLTIKDDRYQGTVHLLGASETWVVVSGTF